jgi:hypothetical protein
LTIGFVAAVNNLPRVVPVRYYVLYLLFSSLISFLTKCNILTETQFGFTEQHSTDMALLSLIDEIIDELDTQNFSLGMFIDLLKTIDTLDHNILLDKLAHYGITAT